MELIISGIKCDALNCDYRDDDVKFEDYPKYINKPCPKCSSNLLTEKEYMECLKMYKRVEYGNAISEKLKYFNPLYYFRKVFGDKRKINTITIEYRKRNENI